MILAEVTSPVDPGTGLLIQPALERLKKACSTIIIADRFSIVSNADQIVVQEKIYSQSGNA